MELADWLSAGPDRALLHYPGVVGDGEGELTLDRLEVLLTWHDGDPVSEYERHRTS
jgi:endonuclease G